MRSTSRPRPTVTATTRRSARFAPLVAALLTVGLAACGSSSPKLADDPSRTPADSGSSKASGVVDVQFENPGNAVDALRERTVTIDEATDVLRMRITDMTYRGIVCGFTFRGGAPASPVTIRIKGKTPKVSFDSGAVPVSWTAPNDDSVESGYSSSNGWNFSAAANTNRNGPGWVVSLGGVTSPGRDTIPTEATCEIRAPKAAFTPAVGPVGYWAAFAGA